LVSKDTIPIPIETEIRQKLLDLKDSQDKEAKAEGIVLKASRKTKYVKDFTITFNEYPWLSKKVLAEVEEAFLSQIDNILNKTLEEASISHKIEASKDSISEGNGEK